MSGSSGSAIRPDRTPGRVVSRTTRDALIVGAGMAGLTAAAFLAREGRSVLLCEKEARCGGLVGSFNRDGFVFDSGIRALENSGVLFPMLRRLGIDMAFVRSTVSLGVEDTIVRLPDSGSVEAYERFLIALFPESAADVRGIVADISRFMRHRDVLYGIDNPLFFKENTRMLFGDAKESISQLIRQFK